MRSCVSVLSSLGVLAQLCLAQTVSVGLTGGGRATDDLTEPVMGVASLILNSGNAEGTLASAVSQSSSRGIVEGIGQPGRIGGNTQPAIQGLFPKVGHPPQALVRSKALSSALGIAFDVLEGKDMIDLAFTAGLAFSCAVH